MTYLIKIAFLEFRWLDAFDIFLVGVLLYQLYKLLKGSLAFNIFIGLILVYLMSLLVKALDMRLLSGILGRFIDVGVILLLIVFQPEIRRSLVFIGRGNILKKENVWKKFLSKRFAAPGHVEHTIEEICIAVEHLSKTKTGVLIIFPKTSELQSYADTGIPINGKVSSKMLESIFNKKSPLHDGAVIIANEQIKAANCVLPVSENPDLPKRVGMRHRAAVGMTELSDAFALIVSEETGHLSYAMEGKLIMDLKLEELKEKLYQFLTEGITSH